MFEPKIRAGKLYQVCVDTYFIRAQTAQMVLGADGWDVWDAMVGCDFELVPVPANAIIMVVKVNTLTFRTESGKNPYLRVYSLYNEQILHMGDLQSRISGIIRPINNSEAHVNL